jgi:ActR/RegA family two-component response regulator
MSQSHDDTIVSLLTGYSSVNAAVDAFKAVRAVYDERAAEGADNCDAARDQPT